MTRMEDEIEREAPGFRDLILGRHLLGPADLSVNANLSGGAINAGTAHLYQQAFLRPTPGLGRPETPIDRLYLGGASAHPGGGVHGVPARTRRAPCSPAGAARRGGARGLGAGAVAGARRGGAEARGEARTDA